MRGTPIRLKFSGAGAASSAAVKRPAPLSRSASCRSPTHAFPDLNPQAKPPAPPNNKSYACFGGAGGFACGFVRDNSTGAEHPHALRIDQTVARGHEVFLDFRPADKCRLLVAVPIALDAMRVRWKGGPGPRDPVGFLIGKG